MIEKTVYHQIHGLLFSGGRSSPRQRKLLRELFYDSYYSYVYRGKNVEVEKFNNKLYSICSSHEVRDLDMSTTIEKEDGKLLLTDEKPYYVEEDYGVENFKNIQPETESIIKDETVALEVQRFKELDFSVVNTEQISEELNLALAKSSSLSDLVEYIGYYRCFSILKKFIYCDKYRLFERSEIEFVRNSLPFISKYRLRFKNINYDYICTSCGNVGRHKSSRIEKKTCFESQWFDSGGLLKLDFGVSDVTESEYIKDGIVTTYAMIKCFRYGIFFVDQKFPYKFHSLVNGNNNYIAFNKFVSDIENLGINSFQYSFVCADDYLLFERMINDLRSDFCNDQWLDYFNQTKNQWNVVFNKICNTNLNSTSSNNFRF